MPGWKLKSALHRFINRLPCPRLWNELFQAHVTRSIEPTEGRCEAKLRDCRAHLEAYLAHSPAPREDFSAFDLGTGWSPVAPVGLALCGAREVWTCDVAPLLTRGRTRRALRQLAGMADRGALQRLLPARPDRLDLLRRALERRLWSPADLLAPLGVRVLVGDARRLELADASCDLAVSVDCLDEIAEPVLAGILAELRRVISPRGVVSLSLELADLYSYFDSRITAFNYMRFTDEEWARYDSPLTPQNRLRISDYRRLLRAAGFEVVHERNTAGDREDLRRVPLAPRFRSYPEEDLLVTRSWMTARPK
jgi:hypothetical protein